MRVGGREVEEPAFLSVILSDPERREGESKDPYNCQKSQCSGASENYL